MTSFDSIRPDTGDLTPSRYPLEFTGTASEYFRIWIVNLALTVLTLGIWSAWAKVRRRRYITGNTWIDGVPFEYHGQPVAILKGRLIAVAILAAGSIVGNISPTAGFIIGVVQIFAFPWLIVRSLAFNARNTSHRGIRFRFHASWLKLLGLFAGWGLLTLVTLGATWPLLKSRLVTFIMSHSAFGATPVTIGPLTRSFYRIYMIGALLLVIGLCLLGAAGAVLGMLSAGVVAPVAATLFGLAFYLLVVLEWALLTARVTNATSNAITLGPVRIESTLGARELASLYVVNAVAVLVTLGLAIPWATIRKLRYRASCTTIVCAGSLEQFIAASAPEESPTGEAIADLLDFDIGL
jgi:uncharacterized membrane protein YjgN (DUF898 family)